MGQVPLPRRGHCRPHARHSAGGPGDTALLISSDPKEGRPEDRQKSQDNKARAHGAPQHLPTSP